MNKYKNINKWFIGMFAIAMLFSCNFPEDDEFYIPFEAGVVENPETITQLIIANEDLGIFEQALRILEQENNSEKLLAKLNLPNSNTTVFAPSNAAFQAWLDNSGIDDISLINPIDLEVVILNHILVGEFKAADFTTGLTTSSALVGPRATAKNVSMYIDTTNGVIINGESTVITPDVGANNGALHIVDTVIDLPVMLDFSAMLPSLSMFDDAVEFAQTARDEDGNGPNLRFRLVDPGAERTLFMPTDDAFADLLVELGVAELSEVDPSIVADAIFTHLIDIAPISTPEFIEIGRPFPIPAFNNELLFINPTDVNNITVTDPNGRTANLVPTLIDIVAVNGFIHVIDKVLLSEAE
ncbi:fasciclin domain-containing protein [Algibacter pectinivorans]|uniref:Uncaracterized surface protein containing fasciclin (FAS1) repeats n=1 Tax=Algibacter pectinivorans TaxID=870482 RepID=A0A1I1R6L5_9FLAO|nr:fasciclin domain-containing protein [Algibacter pectinivorans]SFD27203.1 Uncaracterized surface protein containing fasciclin (FAS1) repeats [Algibacter pectinivorans]